MFEREMACFKRLLPDMKPLEGQFGVFTGDGLYAVRATWGEALELAYKDLGAGHFMVKQIKQDYIERGVLVCLA